MTSSTVKFSDLSFIDLKLINDPIDLFNEWYIEAKKFLKEICKVICLSTVSRNGTPRSRHVFLQGHDKNGFEFFTDSRGRKAQEIAENNHGSMSTYWIYKNDKDEQIIKQVRIEGIIEMLPRDKVEMVYNAEPFHAKIRSHLCYQDAVVDWNDLKKHHDNLVACAKMDNSFLEMAPDHYVGYRLKPKWMDFYSSKNECIADRIEFERSEDENEWIHRRLGA